MNDLYKNIEEYSVIKKQKLLTIFYDIVADMSTNKNLNPIVIELLIKARKLKIYTSLTRYWFYRLYKKYTAPPYSFLVIMLLFHGIIFNVSEKIFKE